MRDARPTHCVGVTGDCSSPSQTCGLGRPRQAVNHVSSGRAYPSHKHLVMIDVSSISCPDERWIYQAEKLRLTSRVPVSRGRICTDVAALVASSVASPLRGGSNTTTAVARSSVLDGDPRAEGYVHGSKPQDVSTPLELAMNQGGLCSHLRLPFLEERGLLYFGPPASSLSSGKGSSKTSLCLLLTARQIRAHREQACIALGP